MSDFDIEGARKAGYSDTEIADHLAKSRSFDAAGARKAGYSDADILSHLSGPPAASAPAAPAASPPGARPVSAAMAIGSPQPPAPPPDAAPGPSKPWGDVATEAWQNAPKSAGNLLHAMVQPIIHPQDTGNALAGVVRGLEKPMQMVKVQMPNGQMEYQPQPVPETPEQTTARTAPANAVGKFYADRYGSMEGFKNALASDPFGVAADISVPLTGGGGALARAPGVVGKVGEVASAAGRVIDPVTQSVNLTKQLGGYAAKGAELAGSNALGLTTGAGPASVRAAARAGAEGGEAGQAFRDSMRGNTPIEDVVSTAKSALDQVRQDRAKAYKAGMTKVGNDKTVLDFQPIEDALGKAGEVGTYKGVVVNRSAGETVDKVTSIVNEWKGLDPKEFHTPEGLDALKRTIGDLRDSTEHGTPARVAADRVYNAVKKEIATQAPDYAKTMEAYAKASDNLKEVTKTLSLGEKATGDAAGRKLLSATRNNAQTNYGQRVKLIDQLAEHEPTLPYQIAGQSMNALAPQGLVGRGGLMAAGGSVIANPANALMLPAFSPRIVGETAHMLGRGAGTADQVMNAFRINAENLRRAGRGGYQSGRLQEAQ